MSSPYTRSQAYTLLEVLVVVLITGIMTGLVVFALGRDNNTDPDKQLERLAALSEHWCQRAVLEGRPLGIRITDSGYDFWIPDSLGEAAAIGDENHWQPVTEQAAFAEHQWADTLQPELLLQGQLAPLDALQPQIICFESSELTPFVINLRRPGEQPAVLEGSLAGRLRLTDHDS